jgi:carbamoyl-phosphate synthase large subunit
VPLASDARAYAEALKAIVRRHEVRFIVPLTDVEVDALAPRKEAFAALGAAVCCPDAPVAALCRDKLCLSKLLGAAGVCTVIPTYTADTLPADPPFPLVVQARSGPHAAARPARPRSTGRSLRRR